ncbi:unnamed protein product [Rotaria sordida]|uniref:Uncharacterized protein n=1 Tax=Rotaria sordida TaxID=392033 RepID=A0A815LWR7_9BILA|nr:unnamed protein product [Rotaria sordida]
MGRGISDHFYGTSDRCHGTKYRFQSTSDRYQGPKYHNRAEITDSITGNLKYVTPRRLKITQQNWNDNHFIYVSKPTAATIAATR